MLLFFFFNDTATTEIYTLSLHDALPILAIVGVTNLWAQGGMKARDVAVLGAALAVYDLIATSLSPLMMDQLTDRKSTRLNSSHANISYAVFCLKKKKKM